MIEIKDIEKMAELSRINVSDDEKEAFLKDMESILDYVGQIKSVAGMADQAIISGEGELKNVFREDENCHDAGLFTEDLLKTAPEKEGAYIKVKKIM